MKNKKYVALLLSMAMLVSSLVGCGSKEAGSAEVSESSFSEQKETESQSSSEKEPVSYTYTFGTQLNGPADEDSVMELYWEERLGHDFESMYFEKSQYFELLNLEISGENIPDVITVSPNVLFSYVDQGAIGGFSREFLKEHAPLLYESIQSDLGEVGFDCVSVDGLMYALPMFNVNMGKESPVIWNLDWLDAVGYEGIPTTLKEFEEVLRKFATEDPDGNGVNDTYGFSSSAFNMFYGAFGCAPGAWKTQKDGSVAYGFMQEGYKDALAWLAEMYAEGVLDPEYVTGENTGGYWAISHKFAEERIGLTSQGCWYHWPTRDVIDSGLIPSSATPQLIYEMETGMNYGFGNDPVGPNGDYGIINTSSKPVPMFAFSAELVEDEERFVALLEAIEVISGLHDIEDGITMFMGIKGEHWDYDENGQPKAIGEVDSISLGAHATFMAYEPVELMKLFSKNQIDWIEGVHSELQLKNMEYIQFFNELPSEQMYLSELQVLFSEATAEIISGAKSIDYYDEVAAKARKSGYDTLAKEAAEAYASGLYY